MHMHTRFTRLCKYAYNSPIQSRDEGWDVTRMARFDGALLQSLRKSRDWSLDELSRRSGVSISHISQLEKGSRKSPSIELVYQLAEVLEVSMYTLLQIGEDDRNPAEMNQAYPELTGSAAEPRAGATAERLITWEKTLRPDVWQFVQSERAEEYLALAKKLYDARNSTAKILQTVQEFIAQETQEGDRT